MRLLIARHGEIESNTRRVLDTSVPGGGLTTRGIGQARELGRAMRHEDIAVIVASPMARAQQTAALVSESVGLPVLVRDGVREISAGDLDLRGDPEAIDRYRGVTFAWAAGQLDIAMPAGDTGRVVLARFDQVIDETEQLTGEPSRAALVISHGAVICTWVGSRARNVDVGFLRDRPLPNAGLAVLAGGSRAGWHAVSWNDVEIPGRPAAAGD